MVKNRTPLELADRARQLADKRDRQAVSDGLAWREQHLRAAAANYRALAEELEHQMPRLQSLREELGTANAAREMARELANYGKT
jgi:hypothetical protein